MICIINLKNTNQYYYVYIFVFLPTREFEWPAYFAPATAVAVAISRRDVAAAEAEPLFDLLKSSEAEFLLRYLLALVA